jgi:hypothetical protein
LSPATLNLSENGLAVHHGSLEHVGLSQPALDLADIRSCDEDIQAGRRRPAPSDHDGLDPGICRQLVNGVVQLGYRLRVEGVGGWMVNGQHRHAILNRHLDELSFHGTTPSLVLRVCAPGSPPGP